MDWVSFCLCWKVYKLCVNWKCTVDHLYDFNLDPITILTAYLFNYYSIKMSNKVDMNPFLFYVLFQVYKYRLEDILRVEVCTSGMLFPSVRGHRDYWGVLRSGAASRPPTDSLYVPTLSQTNWLPAASKGESTKNHSTIPPSTQPRPIHTYYILYIYTLQLYVHIIHTSIDVLPNCEKHLLIL